MMQRYSSSQGQCYSCGLFHHHTQTCNSSSFSVVFSKQNGSVFDQTQEYPFVSSSVDCTLSLGTPSTRLCEEDEKLRRRSTSSCMSNFCWDLLHTTTSSSSSNSNNNTKTASYGNPYKTGRGGSNGGSNGNDPLLARRCANCDTTSTPLWRNGPRGPKSLCNACGIRFKKEERRTTAASGVAAANGAADHHYNTSYNYQNASGNNTASWVHHHAQTQRVPCYPPAVASEFRFVDDVTGSDVRDSDIPFLSWRLNVADSRASLVHDFTR